MTHEDTLTQYANIANSAIPSPKQYAEHSSEKKNSKIFPYYAGYSKAFATKILLSLQLPQDALVLDPWNGAGTTTKAANELGYRALGYDLNPTMVVVAKAALLRAEEGTSLLPLAMSILERVELVGKGSTKDPLCVWLAPNSAKFIRGIEREINRSLIKHDSYQPLHSPECVDEISPLAAFFYVVLFRTVRRLIVDFIPSNPTWTKKPAELSDRKSPKSKIISQYFIEEVKAASATFIGMQNADSPNVRSAKICLGKSQSIPIGDATVDVIVSSPPYCTRIDYAVATAIELAILRFEKNTFDELRRSLMGTSTVFSSHGPIQDKWGATCIKFLEQVYSHHSKASKTYYYKNHIQYFSSLNESIEELKRVIKRDGICVLVLQDSYYKNVFNDVPKIVTEMAENVGFTLVRREDFAINKSMVGLNAKAKLHLTERRNVESVLILKNN